MHSRSRLYGLALLGAWLTFGCGPANRAMVHEDDFQRVFPWPRDSQRAVIRVKPQTAMARYFMVGSYQEVEVDPSTTFYITDELNKQFAYTPARSPIRRLSTVKSIQIRWPVGEGGAVTDGRDKRDAPAPPKPSAEEEEEEEEE